PAPVLKHTQGSDRSLKRSFRLVGGNWSSCPITTLPVSTQRVENFPTGASDPRDGVLGGAIARKSKSRKGQLNFLRATELNMNYSTQDGPAPNGYMVRHAG